MAPIGTKLWENAFQVIPNVSFFDAKFCFSEKYCELWKSVYPPRMAPIDLKLGQNAFQVIPELSLFNVKDRKKFGFFGFDLCHSRDTCILARDTCVLAQDTCVLGRDTCVWGRDTCVLGRDTCVFGRDTFVLGRDTCVLAQGTFVLAQDTCVPARTKRSRPKNPNFFRSLMSKSESSGITWNAFWPSFRSIGAILGG